MGLKPIAILLYAIYAYSKFLPLFKASAEAEPMSSPERGKLQAVHLAAHVHKG